MIHEPSPSQVMAGVTVQGLSYCQGELCMSWENTGLNDSGINTGYCKLIEIQFPIGE